MPTHWRNANPVSEHHAENTQPCIFKLLVLYKIVKGTASLILALLVFMVTVSGTATELGDALAQRLHHLTHPWARPIADAFISSLHSRYLFVAAAAFGVDGTLTVLEGWALTYDSWWGVWLVVISTSLLLIPEGVSLAQKLSVMRAAILIINVVVVVYLARHAWRKQTVRNTLES